MTRLNTLNLSGLKNSGQRTHEGAPARNIPAEWQLRRSVLACMLWEDQFYEDGVAIAGRIEPVPARSRSRLAARHIAGRMSVDRVGGWDPGDPASRLANGVRHTLARGAQSLSPSHQEPSRQLCNARANWAFALRSPRNLRNC